VYGKDLQLVCRTNFWSRTLEAQGLEIAGDQEGVGTELKARQDRRRLAVGPWSARREAKLDVGKRRQFVVLAASGEPGPDLIQIVAATAGIEAESSTMES
jgi:hypothetical protein